MTDNENDLPADPPSKSARKRAALALQALGAQLVRMREAELTALPLPENLRDAIMQARQLRSHGALSRQHQYIGKLMRGIDVNALEAALAGLDEAQKARARLRR
jgi:ribosome-associated protein